MSDEPETDTDTDTDTDYSWWRYLQGLMMITGINQRELAERIGAKPSVMSAWKKGVLPRPHLALATARAFDRPVEEAHIAARFADVSDYGNYNPEVHAMPVLSNRQLLEIIEDRLIPDPTQPAGRANKAEDKPVDGRSQPQPKPATATRTRTKRS